LVFLQASSFTCRFSRENTETVRSDLNHHAPIREEPEKPAMTFEINPAYALLLTENRLDSFSDIMHCRRGVRMRAVPGRLTVRLELAAGRSVYLKRHFPPSPVAARAGRQEWDSIKALSAVGVRCPEPVAAGCGTIAGKPCSFIITAAVPGGLPLDDYLRRHFSAAPTLPELHRKRRLIVRLAAFTRRLHRAGYHHKDLYLCHVFVGPSRDQATDLCLIDLQRVGRSWFLQRRWVVKDLAALNYSATADFTRATDRLRFLLHYLGIPRLTPASKRLIRSIARKTERIRRHDQKLQQRGTL
jgi:heptose I phosphotransferase